MIELRRRIELGLRHPVTGPIVILLLILVVALTVIHEAHVSISGHIGELCVAIAFVLLRLVVLTPRSPSFRLVVPCMSPRGPPSPSDGCALTPARATLLPLRL